MTIGVVCGSLRKMRVNANDPVTYDLELGEDSVCMNTLLGKRLEIQFQGEIFCLHCNRKTRKSYSQGYCYPCFKKLAQCDLCIMSPDRCHFAQGTCRDPEWAQNFCMQPHVVYLANSSGLKVGISRRQNLPDRWLDQGARQAVVIATTATRQQCGLIELALKSFVSDRTNWRVLIKQESPLLDMKEEARKVCAQAADSVAELQRQFPQQLSLVDELPVTFNYPVLDYRGGKKSLKLESGQSVTGILQGIKGQYLLLDTGVFNVRAHTSYQVKLIS